MARLSWKVVIIKGAAQDWPGHFLCYTEEGFLFSLPNLNLDGV